MLPNAGLALLAQSDLLGSLEYLNLSINAAIGPEGAVRPWLNRLR